MEFGSAIIAGLVGTAVMTALMYMAPRMGMPEMDIIGMLGTMVTADEGPAKPIGAVMHLMMGAIFAIIYAFLWANVLGAPTWLWGLIFGAVHGIVAIVTMPMMVRMHPRPPEMAMGPPMMAGLLMGHLVFGLVVALVYGALL